MSKKLSDEFVIDKIKSKCELKNYELLNLSYNGSRSIINLKCNTDNHEWKSNYNLFITRNHNCEKCASVLKLTYDEVYNNIITKCKLKNYELLNLSFNGSDTIIHLHCNIDNHEWQTSYKNFINSNYNCAKCGGTLKLSDIEVYNNINKCGYEIIEINYNGNSSIITF